MVGGRWGFSVGIYKYKPGYKSHDLLQILILSLVENLFKKKILYKILDFLSSQNAVISTNESTQIITGHVIYTYKFQLKTTLYLLGLVHCYRVQMQAFQRSLHTHSDLKFFCHTAPFFSLQIKTANSAHTLQCISLYCVVQYVNSLNTNSPFRW